MACCEIVNCLFVPKSCLNSSPKRTRNDQSVTSPASPFCPDNSELGKIRRERAAGGGPDYYRGKPGASGSLHYICVARAADPAASTGAN